MSKIAPETNSENAKALKSVNDFLGGTSNVIGLVFGAVSGIASIAIAFIKPPNGDLTTVSSVFIITIVAMLAYALLHLDVTKKLYTEHCRILMIHEGSGQMYRRIAMYAEHADDIFTELSQYRTEFEKVVFDYLMAATAETDSARVQDAQLDNAYKKFLEMVCETATTAISARKMSPHTIHANIKMFSDNIDGSLHRYATMARSKNTDRERKDTDERENPNYIVEYNGIMHDLLLPNNSKRYWHCEDIEAVIMKWKEDLPDQWREPTLGARHFYKNCLVSLICGENYKKNFKIKDRDSIKINNKMVAIGIITVDSLEEVLSGSPEASIMLELSQNIFAATRAYEVTKEIVQNRLYE